MIGTMLTAALGYAGRGWLVIPLHTPNNGRCSCGSGGDCKAPGKHPRTRHGLKEASTDSRLIHSWWSQWPEANIGIATGADSGVLVVDVDNKGGKRGGDNLASISVDHGGILPTLTATTGNGEHLFFVHPGVVVRNSAGTLAEGVDVRGDGGYVVAAPSLHANGTRYAWKDRDSALAEVPTWLLKMMNGKVEEVTMTQDTECNDRSDGQLAMEGTRNNTLFKLGCSLRGQQGKDRSQITTALVDFNQANCHPPLDISEVIVIVESVCQYPQVTCTKKSGKRLADCQLYWFKFNTREWFADQNVAMMNDEQTGWHTRLNAFAWDKGGYLPADNGKLWRLARAKSRKAFERGCDIVLADYEEVADEADGEYILRHPRMVAEYAKSLDLWIKKKDAGDASFAAHKPQSKSPLARLEKLFTAP